jgi:hypothetical protein
MNNVRYQITNKELFNSILSDVNLESVRGGNCTHSGNLHFVGAIDIVFNEGGSKCYDGEHGPNDFEDSYGFILTLND